MQEIQEQFEELSGGYFAVFGVTFSRFSVVGNEVLMKKAIELMQAALDSDKGKPVTNEDLGIEIPDDALA